MLAPVVAAAQEASGLRSLRDRALVTVAGGAAPAHPVVPASAVFPPEIEARTPPHLQQAYGCLIGGTTSMVVAFAAGAENLVNTIAGGAVPMQNTGVLLLGVTGIVFASFCALGEAVTPIYVYYTEPAPAVHAATPARAGLHSGVLGRSAVAAAQRIDGGVPDPIDRSLAQAPARRH